MADTYTSDPVLVSRIEDLEGRVAALQTEKLQAIDPKTAALVCEGIKNHKAAIYRGVLNKVIGLIETSDGVIGRRSHYAHSYSWKHSETLASNSEYEEIILVIEDLRKLGFKITEGVDEIDVATFDEEVVNKPRKLFGFRLKSIRTTQQVRKTRKEPVKTITVEACCGNE